MNNAAAELTDTKTGFLRDCTHLIIDRDTKYTGKFKETLSESGCDCVVLPPRSPNLNAFAERFVKSIKHECLRHMIFFGQRSLERAIGQYVIHDNNERNHQGVDNELRLPHLSPRQDGSVVRSDLVGC